MTPSVRPLSAVVATALLGVGLSACGGSSSVADPPPAPPSSSSSTPAPTTSSSTPTGPVEPVMPAAAKENTVAGAKAFVRYYWNIVDYAQLTGNTSKLRTLSTGNCEGCDQGRKSIEAAYAKGHSITGGQTSFVKVFARTVATGAEVVAEMHTAPLTEHLGGGREKTYKEYDSRFQVVLTYSGHWRLQHIAQI